MSVGTPINDSYYNTDAANTRSKYNFRWKFGGTSMNLYIKNICSDAIDISKVRVF